MVIEYVLILPSYNLFPYIVLAVTTRARYVNSCFSTVRIALIRNIQKSTRGTAITIIRQRDGEDKDIFRNENLPDVVADFAKTFGVREREKRTFRVRARSVQSGFYTRERFRR